MPERFNNAPLVELVSELRWGGIALGASDVSQAMISPAGQHEEFFMRFGSKVGALGYERIERLVPPGFLVPQFQPTYRFRKRGPEQGTTVYQVGSGVFTANITPPYHSWKQFRPVVEHGVECLLETRNDAERQTEFSQVLRYINAFGRKFTRTRSAARFVEEVLGFTVNLPKAVRFEIEGGADPKILLQLSIPLRSDRQLNAFLAEGITGGEQALIMDLSIVTQNSIVANRDSVMAAFDLAHDIIHRVFIGLTQEISEEMEPVGEETE